MKTKTLFRELVLIGMHSISLIYLVIAWNQLPSEVPMHFNIQGEPDNWTSPMGLMYILIAFNAGLYLLFLLIPKLAAKKYLKTSPNVFIKFRIGLTVLFSAIGFIGVYMAVGDAKIGILSLGILFALMCIFIGNYLQAVKPNYFIGIRTPWTLESETVWRKTHQVGGKLMFWGGVLSVPFIFILPMELSPFPPVGVLVLSSIFAMVYSYLLFKKEKKIVQGGNGS